MKIVKLSLKKIDYKDGQEIIDQLAEVIKSGRILIYPTDTCYGIGIDARKPANLAKIAVLKKRPYEKKFSLLFKNIIQIKKFCRVSVKNKKILKKYLPGPFTFILPAYSPAFAEASAFALRATADKSAGKKASVGGSGKNNNQTIGVRIPDFAFTQQLAERLNFPYTTTSANISEKPSCYSIAELKKQFGEFRGIDLVIDAGRLPKRKTSTVVDLTSKRPKILRRGSGKFKG